jgi:ribonuclease Z
MEIIFLGTSSGTPTKARNVSATVLKRRNQKTWCLVDCGEGTQHQVLRTRLTLNHLSAIMITHVHGDHCFGLPGLLASASMAGRKDPIVVIAPIAIKKLIESAQQITETYLTFKVNFIAVETLVEPVNIGDFWVTTLPLSHRVPCYAYGFVEKQIEHALNTEKLTKEGIAAGPAWGQLQSGQDVVLPDGYVLKSEHYILPKRMPRKVVVGGDNDRPELLHDFVKDSNVLIHESTYTEEISVKVGAGPQHSSAKQVAQFATQVALNNLILTHFSARYQYGRNQDASIHEIEDEANRYYQGHLFLANDFDCFHLSVDGSLNLVDSTE